MTGEENEAKLSSGYFIDCWDNLIVLKHPYTPIKIKQRSSSKYFLKSVFLSITPSGGRFRALAIAGGFN